MDDELAQIFYRLVFGNGHNIGPRRHHFADAFIAERHHRLDELAVFFGQDAFFFAGSDERVDIFRSIAAHELRRCRLLSSSSISDWKMLTRPTSGEAQQG